MRKLLLLLFLTAFIEADAQYFSPRPAIEQWRDSVMQSIRLNPVKSLNFKTLSFPKNEPTRSIMLRNQPVEQSINPASTQVGKFFVYDPEPIFQYNYYYYNNDRTILGAMLDTFLDVLFDNTSKPKPKVSKKTIDY